MPEIKTNPYVVWVKVGADLVECECFGPDHTLADIARWLCKNRSEAKEMLHLIKEELEKTSK